ncbi:hypothetical protein AMTRI_Chr13g87940 [Amborella trichopoda]
MYAKWHVADILMFIHKRLKIPSNLEVFYSNLLQNNCYVTLCNLVVSNHLFDRLHTGSRRPRSLVALCLGVLGKHLEDIIVDLCEVSSIFPPDIKMAILSISRRRKLLDDYSLIALADTSWELLDISGSAVSNVGLERVPGMCPNVKALDISQCDKITADAVSHLLFQCHRLEILRCGGSHRSDFTAWRCLKFLKPSLEVVEEESWEELDSSVLAKGAQSLRWLIWGMTLNRVEWCIRIRVASTPIGWKKTLTMMIMMMMEGGRFGQCLFNDPPNDLLIVILICHPKIWVKISII